MMFFNRSGKQLAMLLLTMLLGLAGMTVTAERANAASYSYRGAPQGTVGLTKPTLVFHYSTDMPGEPSAYSMFINGAEVAAVYEKNEESFVYTPVEALRPGTYTVRMTIAYAGYEPVDKSWTFTVAQDAISQFTPATAEQLGGLAAINDYRTLYGLPQVAMSDPLNTIAMTHARYLDTNQIQQSEDSKESLHAEHPDKPGFTGESPLARGEYFNYEGTVGEDAAYNRGTIAETIDVLFDAPYHRSPFLDPSVKEIGVGKIGDYTIIEFGMKEMDAPRLVVSPAEGDRYAPVRFEGNETPDPLRMHTDHAFPVGYPIMAEYFGPGVDQVKLLAADLSDKSTGKSLDFVINTPDNDDSLTHAFILMTSEPLRADASYHVMLTMQVTKTDGSRSTEVKEWDFTTEPIPTLGKTKLHQNAADYKKRFVSPNPVTRTASFGLDDSRYRIDGVSFPMQLKPVIVDGSSYLYIRDLAAALGASVEWDADLRAAIYRKGGQTVTLYTAKKEIAVNGEVRPTDSPARLIGDNTMVPVRLLAEVLGAKVSYVEATRTVNITY